MHSKKHVRRFGPACGSGGSGRVQQQYNKRIAGWGALLPELDESDQLGDDAPKENQPRCAYPRPAFHTSARTTMRRDKKKLSDHITRTAKLYCQRFRSAGSVVMTNHTNNTEYYNTEVQLMYSSLKNII